MAVNYLIFDGIKSSDYGIYISGEALFNAPKRDAEVVSIPGRNGSFLLDNNRYENIQVTYPAFCYSSTYSGFISSISSFRNAIASKVGYKRLTDTFHTTEYRMGAFLEGLEVDAIKYNSGATFDIVFECKPQRFLTSGESAVTVADGGTITNPTLYDASPLLAVEGYGNISFNGYSVDIENAVLGSVAVGSSGLTAKANSAGISYVDYDTNLYNTGDTLTIGGIKFNVQTRGIPSTSISSVTVITAPSTGTTTSISHMASGSAKYVNIALKYDGFSVASNSTQTISDFARYRISYVSGGVTYTETFDVTLSIHYANDALGLSVTMQENVNGTNYSGASWSASYETTYAYSTKSILGHPTYIDCDLGEAYYIDNGSVIDLNPYIDLGTDLPVLSSGSNTITYDNTVTDFKITPRWWQL